MKALQVVIEIQKESNSALSVHLSADGKTLIRPFQPPFLIRELQTILPHLGMKHFSPDARGIEPKAEEDLGPWFVEIAERIGLHSVSEFRSLCNTPSGRQRIIGWMLYSSIFQDEAHQFVDRILAENQQVLFCFRIDPYNPDLLDVDKLPWELMWRPRDTHPLARTNHAIVRANPHRQSFRQVQELPTRLEILAIIAEPSDEDCFGADRFKRELREAVPSEIANLHFLEPPTAQNLRDHLKERPVHVLQFIGHGGVDGKTGEWSLCFEDEEGRSDYVTGARLANMCDDPYHAPRLVNLISCEGARLQYGDGYNPFNGVARNMVLGGTPAVVAMQYQISYDAARTFSRVFFRRIGCGDAIDEAVRESRVAILNRSPNTLAWANPVLFLDPDHAQLFRDRQHLHFQIAGKPSRLPPGPHFDPERLICPDFFTPRLGGAEKGLSGPLDLVDELIAYKRRDEHARLSLFVSGISVPSIWLTTGFLFRDVPKRVFLREKEIHDKEDIISLGPASPMGSDIVTMRADEPTDRAAVFVALRRPSNPKKLGLAMGLEFDSYTFVLPRGQIDRHEAACPEIAIGLARALGQCLLRLLNELGDFEIHLFVSLPPEVSFFLGGELGEIAPDFIHSIHQGQVGATIALGHRLKP
ncbi:CHAT domain-containing protein [Sulfidibacter corallicola]|uniref:CHAT domain-containing protein n=1 Tax=Sulfidibacter corallicola TaxID=2818388 RepID=A0A8A4TJN5_SULCO|nr:CHAT domain-containing protein [Sulfidibacter corallicola]QTD49760.1 CHAT domain-containing protein [Sulfidibacter corallicola]